MIGPKAGDRLLAAGRPDPALVAELARVTGLNGQTAAACQPNMRHALDAAAAKAGALIDVLETIPGESALIPGGITELDIVVLSVDLGSLNLDERLRTTRDALGVLRPGGRLILIDHPRRGGLLGSRGTPTMPPDAVVPMLTSVGSVASRALGAADGITYYEARRAR